MFGSGYRKPFIQCRKSGYFRLKCRESDTLFSGNYNAGVLGCVNIMPVCSGGDPQIKNSCVLWDFF